jgi:hypothetical protein
VIFDLIVVVAIGGLLGARRGRSAATYSVGRAHGAVR